jgi:hypothetical protein
MMLSHREPLPRVKQSVTDERFRRRALPLAARSLVA